MSEEIKEAASQLEIPRNRSPSKGKEPDEITAKFESRSVSLTRSDAIKKMSPPKKQEKPERKRKNPPETSPIVSVQERKSQFERVQDKYRNQHCLKEIREKSKTDKAKTKREKKSKTPSEDSNNSIASLLKIMHADIKVIKADLKENNLQITTMNAKISAIESENARTTSETNLKIEAIRVDMGNIKTSVTNKVINVIDPKISTLRTELRDDLNTDLRRLVEEEMELKKYKDWKEDSEDSNETEDEDSNRKDGPEKRKKNKKSKKNIKLQNQKKL